MHATKVGWAHPDVPITQRTEEAEKDAITKPAKLDEGKPPVFNGFLRYFPNAIREVAKVSNFGRTKYQVDWTDRTFLALDHDRLLDAMVRHALAVGDGEEINEEDGGALHRAQIAWEALASLEIYLRKREEKEE